MSKVDLPENHPAYGSITVHRVSQSAPGRALFRSPFKHMHYISLSIRRASLKRDLNRDWHMPEEEIVEVHMSETQFAQLLSSHSLGEGVPCTINHLDHKTVADPPIDEFRLRHEKELDEKIRNLHASVINADREISQILNQKTLKVADKNRIKSLLGHISRELTSNLDFVINQYMEKISEVTDEAQNEIRASIVNRMQTIGLTKLAEEYGIESPIEVKLLSKQTSDNEE